jgi:hypothetical protein
MTNIFKSSVTTKTVETIIYEVTSENSTFDINPVYQREIIWDEIKMSHFINSIMEGIIPSPLILNRDEENNKKICIDGKQRISSLCRFKDNFFSVIINNRIVYYSAIPEKKEQENILIMTKKEQSIFNGREINIIEYKNLKFEEQIDIFNRIQNGKKLTKSEILSASFNNEDVCKIFKQFCLNEKIIKSLSKICIDKKIPILVTKLLYMFDKKELKILINKECKTYLKKIVDVGEFNEILNKLSKIIEFYFSDKILYNKNFNQKLEDECLVIVYYLDSLYNNNIFNFDILKLNNISKAISIIYLDLNNNSIKNKHKITSICIKLDLHLNSKNKKEEKSIVNKKMKIVTKFNKNDDLESNDSEESEKEESLKVVNKTIIKKKIKIV